MIIGGMNTTDIVRPSLSPPDGAAALADWGLIRADGADAASFLQSQLTQNVLGLGQGQATLAGFCSPKGRLLASFVVWRDDAQTFWLACSADLLAPTLKRLSMFVLRAKCKLGDASAAFATWGLAGPTAASVAADLAPWQTAVRDGRRLIRLPDGAGVPRVLLLQPAEQPSPALPPLDADTWRWLEVHSGVVRVVAATVEQFVPQMVNFELVGGVDFQKGCYPGQEVVARSQYRGTLKRRAMVFSSGAELAVGQEVFHEADPGQPAGLIALAARRPGGDSAALVEVKLAALDGGRLHAGAADGPLLQRGALPYPIPSATA